MNVYSSITDSTNEQISVIGVNKGTRWQGISTGSRRDSLSNTYRRDILNDENTMLSKKNKGTDRQFTQERLYRSVRSSVLDGMHPFCGTFMYKETHSFLKMCKDLTGFVQVI